MELRQLRSALALAGTRHFTHAAEQLAIAQPALSQQIKALEEELGVRLFERTSRRVRLTDAGTAFVAEARRIVDEAERLETTMREYAGLLRGRVVVGAMQLFSETMLPRLLGRFHREFPGIEIALREDVTQAMLTDLRAGSLDLAIANVADPQAHPDLLLTSLGDDEVALAVAVTHPLAERKVVRLDELRDEQFVVYAAGAGLQVQLLSAAREAGFTPRIAFESADSWTLRALASEGLGIGMLPRTFLESPGPPIGVVALDPPIYRSVTLAQRRASLPSRAAQVFTDFVRDAFSQHGLRA
ncbi:MAG TPA: LysR family transcriptional regulator [Candidatus Acidoferrales bacterium]|nr:LysR family transcriptional regulator [Candidatus Acidoferrales bacterium]